MITFTMKNSRFLLVFVAILISSCRTNTSPQGNGTIVGRVILFDSTGTVQTDFSGIQVSVDGTPMSMVTDSTGDWQFSGVSNGTYNVTATKAGFGTYHWYEQNVNNGPINVVTAAIAQMPSYTPAVLSASIDTFLLNELVTGAYSQLPVGVNIAGYCDLDSNVQPSDPHLMVAVNIDNSGGGGTYFSYDDLLAAGARPGQTLYLSAANVFIGLTGYNIGVHATFIDPSHNR